MNIGHQIAIPPRWRKVWRDIHTNVARTILVVLSIAVGVFAIGVIFGSQHLLINDVEANYQQGNPSDARLSVRTFDTDLVKTVTRMPSVALAEGRNRLWLRVQSTNGTWHQIFQSNAKFDHDRLLHHSNGIR